MSLLTAHSHWDDPNGDFELQLCLDVIAKTSVAGSEIAHIPFRENGSPNFYDLLVNKTGFGLTCRVNNVAHAVKQTFATPQKFDAGSNIMFDFVAQGDIFTLYELLGATVATRYRGAKLYEWTDTTYKHGVNISYYTVHGWQTRWDNIFATKLDNYGMGHEIHQLNHDARNVPLPSGAASTPTFDSPLPSKGQVLGINSTRLAATTGTYGCAHGANYEWDISIDKPGSGHFDFRDPAAYPSGVGPFFSNSYYRLSLGSTPSIQRFDGSSASKKYTASRTISGQGTYKLKTFGPTITLLDPAGNTLISVNDGGPQSGVRVRVSPGDQNISWVGTPA